MFHSAIYWPARFSHLAQQAQQPVLQNFYAQPVIDGSTPICECPLVALDFETTGLNAQQDAILSIGLVPFNTQRIALNQAQYWLVQPTKPLEEGSVVIHGITHSELRHAQNLKWYLVNSSMHYVEKLLLPIFAILNVNFCAKRH